MPPRNGPGERPGARGPKPVRAPRRTARGFRHFVVCLDRSPPSERALAHALALAGPSRARVTLLHVVEPRPTRADSPVGPDPLDFQLREAEATAYLEGLRASQRVEASVDVAVVQGKAAEQICAFVASSGADLTVFATHGERGLGGWCLGSTARKLVEGLPGSFLLVPCEREPSREAPRYERILVPLDGSARAESVLPLATRVARDAGAELVIVHAVGANDPLEGEPLTVEDEDLQRRVARRQETRAREYLARRRARVEEGGPKVRATVLRGRDVRRELATAILREHADLVVLSAHGHRARTEEPSGSVAAHLLRMVSVPMLVRRDRAAYLAWRRRAQGAEDGAALPPLDPLAR